VQRRVTALSAVSVLVAGRNIAGSPLSIFVQERIIPHTKVLPIYDDDDSTPHDRCWATIVTSPSFVLGAIALGHSLNSNSASSAAAKIALVTAPVTFVDRCVLSAAGWLLRNVSVIPNPNAAHVPHFSSVYSKLHVFALQRSCGRVVYIDADVVAVDVCPLFSSSTCACLPMTNALLALQARAASQLFDIDLQGCAQPPASPFLLIILPQATLWPHRLKSTPLHGAHHPPPTLHHTGFA